MVGQLHGYFLPVNFSIGLPERDSKLRTEKNSLILSFSSPMSTGNLCLNTNMTKCYKSPGYDSKIRHSDVSPTSCRKIDQQRSSPSVKAD